MSETFATRPSRSFVLANQRSGAVICEDCSLADTPWRRLRGLLGRDGLEAGHGLLIRPTWSVHTGFMRFPIDVVFLDRELVVMKVAADVKPWRSASQRGAKSALELPAGASERLGVTAGDRLESLSPAPVVRTARQKLAIALTSALAVVLALAALIVHGPGAAGWIGAFVCVVLVRLSYIDATTRLLPNRIVLPAAAIVLALQLATAPGQWLTWIGASFGAAALLLVAALIRPGGLGMGDVKLMLLLGAALGTAVAGAFFVGMALAAVAGLALILRHGWAARAQTIALGPYLAAGAIFMLLAG
jgi:uncharacterized membrane protein (UPF0127 family)/Flp pilus assembly protein protease CpaA